jgi:hypothetical protein
MILSRRMALLMAPSLILICAEGVAQTPAQDSASAPRLQLSGANAGHLSKHHEDTEERRRADGISRCSRCHRAGVGAAYADADLGRRANPAD